jgi:small glutamine-rich tetratricopeptide repeat-containing protein alpha
VKLSENKYDEAIELYTQAINLDPTSAVYYSNRAAAYSLLGKHNAAIEDCNAALKIDSNYSKAYSRLGLAYFELAKYKESVDAYKNALALEPSNTNVQQFLATAEAKLKLSDLSGTTSSTARSGPSMPPGGGMPDLSSLLNNPALMNMAQQFMGGQGADAGAGAGAGAGGLG